MAETKDFQLGGLPLLGKPDRVATMKQGIGILFIVFMANLCLAQNSFYVWQQLWSSNVIEAVVNEPATTMYPIATVVPPRGKSKLVRIPWDTLRKTSHRFIPVIRVPLKAFNRADIVEELVRIATELSGTEEIQLDLDCPESRLEEYARLIVEFRERVPNRKVSITALPSQLNNRAFPELAATTDYYVLQVHGLNVPKNINETAELMNPRTAKKAISRAEALGHPYSIALPCYAYELNFDPASGAFLFLTAERPVRRQQTIKKRVAANPNDLIQLLEIFQQLKHARDIIWFRLPVAGDRLCLPRPTLATIESGECPGNAVECTTRAISDRSIEIELRNQNTIHAQSAMLTLNWKNPRGSFDCHGEAVATAGAPGMLPSEIRVPIPLPGQSTTIGWFETSTPPTITLSLK